MTTESDTHRLAAIYLDDHRAGAAGGLALARRIADRYADEPGYEALREFAQQVEEDASELDRLRTALDASGGDLKRLVALAGERLGRLKPNGRVVSESPLSRVEELEQMAAGVFAKRQLWRTVAAWGQPGSDAVDVDRLIERAEGQLSTLADLHRRAVGDAFGGATEAVPDGPHG